MTTKSTVVLLAGLYGVSGAPVSNDTLSWQNEPDGRGTWSILSSCILTLILCVYTAVHMNVPAAAEPKSRRLRHLIGWVITGTFAPELVVWIAWTQWSEARKVTAEMKRYKARLDDKARSTLDDTIDLNEIAPLVENWTSKHSFFVVMGGFQFRPSSMIQQLDPQNGSKWENYLKSYKMQPKSVLTSAGLLSLLSSGHGSVIPVLTVGDIEDRSKADALAKVLSCLQGFWLIFQIIARVTAGLTVTELEVNTLAHVICALIMYVFWMNKPLKIEQPVWVGNERILSWSVFHSGLNLAQRSWLRKSTERQTKWPTTAFPGYAIHHHSDCTAFRDCPTCASKNASTGLKGLMLRPDVTILGSEIVSTLEQVSDNFKLCDFVIGLDGNFKDKSGKMNMRHVVERQYPVDLLSVNQAELDFLLRILLFHDRAELIRNMGPDELTELERSSRMFKISYVDNHMALTLVALVSSLYGGLHAALWRHNFPTVVEKWLWRVSSICVAGNGLNLAFLGLLLTWKGWYHHSHQQSRFSAFWGKILDQILVFVRSETCLWIEVAVQALFVFCRMFLLIEAFISLRSQPPSAYQTPNFARWIPHL